MSKNMGNLTRKHGTQGEKTGAEKPDSGLRERLIEVRKRLKKSQSEMADLVGVALSTWQTYEHEGKSPKSRVFAALADLGVPLNWLLTGVGSDLILSPEGRRERAALAAASDLAVIDVYDARFAAGAGFWSDPENIVDQVLVPRKLLRGWGLPPENAVIVRNIGDSMEPTIGDGDHVLLDRSINSVALSDMIYAFRLNDELRIKRIRRLHLGGFELRSDNAKYPPEQLPGPNLYDFTILGRVRTVWRNLP